jgi:hypothetical protein
MKYEKMPLEGYIIGAIILYGVFGLIPTLYWILK